jgi:type I restriction enzyme R subunit
MKSDTSEGGLEALIVADMTGTRGLQPVATTLHEPSDPLAALRNWQIGDPKDYDRAWTLDLVQFTDFIRSTQPALVDALSLDEDTPTRQKFLGRLQGEITKRGVIDVLRKGVKHGPHDVTLFYATPSAGNTAAQARFRLNRFTVTRQLRYSLDETANALDLALFINGLPVATFELKNSLTKQTVDDAVRQYQRDRDPRERLFEFGRCSPSTRSAAKRVQWSSPPASSAQSSISKRSAPTLSSAKAPTRPSSLSRANTSSRERRSRRPASTASLPKTSQTGSKMIPIAS